MLDVHPAHHSATTWRDFLIHIATIVIGLLIAIGLEQSVEMIHRAHQRRVLRDSLAAETEQILKDSGKLEQLEVQQNEWSSKFLDQMSEAAAHHHPIGVLPPRPPNDADLPDDPVYTTAAASNQLGLLSREEAQAYGEIHDSLLQYKHAEADHINMGMAAGSFLVSLGYGKEKTASPLPWISTATPEEARQLYNLLVAANNAGNVEINCLKQLHGGALAMQRGERNLAKIEESEKIYSQH